MEGLGTWKQLNWIAKEEGRSHLEDQLDRPLDQPVEFLNSTGQASTRSSWSQTFTLGKGWLGIEKPNIKRSLDTRSFKS
ncbi:unnamed protein product [Microthlaspi erraticum]|uniref:Uncharacterized protein n=1 Tax=Microthlaspi erraticum TaxID=1685480 RepID=A0A6D2IW50_9BRAS|nr:unnamed protein product [Microthlaspi erraticum]